MSDIFENETIDARTSLWSRFVLLAKSAAAAILLIWLLMSGQLDVQRLAALRWSNDLVLFGLLVFASMAIPALRWWWLLRIQQIREPITAAFTLTWLGYFTSLVLPGAASGDVAKSMFIIRRQPRARVRALSTILADRFLGVYSLLILAALSLVWLELKNARGAALQTLGQLVAVLVLASSLCLAMLFWGPYTAAVQRLLPERWNAAWGESLQHFRRGWLPFLGCFILSLVSNTCAIACFPLCASLLGEYVDLSAAFLVGPLVFLANSVPLTPGGVGVGEAASSKLFEIFGVSSGAEMMVLLRLGLAVMALPGVAALVMSSKTPNTALEHA